MNLTSDKHYWTVHLGPRLDLPRWHVLREPSSYQFPSLDAANRFAKAHKEESPRRDVVIEFPDGRRWNGKEWV